MSRTLKTKHEEWQDKTSSEKLIIQRWKTLVFHFSSRHLTFEHDTLPAFSGFAKQFQAYNLGKYYAGMWQSHLHSQLVWSSGSEGLGSNRSKSYIAPTWSWASVMGTVGTGLQSVHQLGRPAFALHKLGVPDLDLVGRIVDVQCTLAGLDPTGAVMGGTLTIRTTIIEAKLISDLEKDSTVRLYGPHEYVFWIVHKTNRERIRFKPDSITDIDVLSDETDVICAQLTIRPEWDSLRARFESIENIVTVSYFLVLRLSKRAPSSFERLGLLKIYEHRTSGEDTLVSIKDGGEVAQSGAKVWLSGSETRTVTII